MSDSNRAHWPAYEGWYVTFGFTTEIKILDGRLVAAVPGVPPGYEILLEPAGEHAYRMTSGPAQGAVGRFRFAADDRVDAFLIGEMELARVSVGQVAPSEAHQRLLAPPLRLDDAGRQAFAALLATILERRDGDWIEYGLPYPKHEFLRYVADQQLVLFHGSNHADIDEFRPRRSSYELRDQTGRGNQQAVYATHDGLWPLFFAVVDRQRLAGSIRNGVMYFQNGAGEALPVYNFSINRDQLEERPWCTGTLYFLPRDTFTRLPLVGDALSNEWASPAAVRPIARLRVEPEDFPFLDAIGGHDDEALQRFGELRKRILAAVTDIRLEDGGMVLSLHWDDDLAALFPEFLDLQRVLLPAAHFNRAIDGPSTARLTVDGPAAFMQVLRDELSAGG